jgi:glycosyltransferase involved in cell wall biosynthesis
VLFEALRGVEARALIVGFGDYRAQLESLAPPGTLFTGALEHRHLVHLIPLCDACVVPSIFPEAFGMVAAEAAAAGVLPVVANHSGLAEVGAGIATELPADRGHLVTFENGDADALRARLQELLALPADERRALGLSARRAVERNWSWRRVSERLLQSIG